MDGLSLLSARSTFSSLICLHRSKEMTHASIEANPSKDFLAISSDDGETLFKGAAHNLTCKPANICKIEEGHLYF